MAKVAMNGERENRVPMGEVGMGAPQESTPQDIESAIGMCRCSGDVEDGKLRYVTSYLSY